MMMSKPRPSAETKQTPSAEMSVQSKPSSANEAVEDLARRLALLGGAQSTNALAASQPASQPVDAIGDANKNPLLARIMAAQERAKDASAKPTLSHDGAQAMAHGGSSHALSFEMTMASPKPFDTFAMPQDGTKEVTMPLEPSFDLLDLQPTIPNAQLQQVRSEPLEGFDQLLSAHVPSILSPEEEMIMGMEGLTDQERKALIAEQRTIMDQIQKEKAANEAAIAAAAADDFDQRSAPAVANVAGGGAPTVRRASTSGDRASSSKVIKEEDMQMELDRRMAEQMQKEEYEAVAQINTNASTRNVATTDVVEETSWWDTVSGMFSVKMANEAVQHPPQRGQVSASPSSPGASRPIDYSSSGGGERDGLLGNAGGRKARIAEKKPMLSCVVDSVATAGTFLGSALTGQTLSQDEEGNVHGVDASSLLSMSSASRDTDYKPL